VGLACAAVGLAVAVPRALAPSVVAAGAVAVALFCAAAGTGVLTPDKEEHP
jgi:hypothetical protein